MTNQLAPVAINLFPAPLQVLWLYNPFSTDIKLRLISGHARLAVLVDEIVVKSHGHSPLLLTFAPNYVGSYEVSAACLMDFRYDSNQFLLLAWHLLSGLGRNVDCWNVDNFGVLEAFQTFWNLKLQIFNFIIFWTKIRQSNFLNIFFIKRQIFIMAKFLIFENLSIRNSVTSNFDFRRSKYLTFLFTTVGIIWQTFWIF